MTGAGSTVLFHVGPTVKQPSVCSELKLVTSSRASLFTGTPAKGSHVRKLLRWKRPGAMKEEKERETAPMQGTKRMSQKAIINILRKRRQSIN